MSNYIEVFTDGSYEPQIAYGAWAALIIFNENEKMLSGTSEQSSQHKMELQAVIQSLEYITEHYGKDLSIKLYTDSEYVENLLSRKEKLLKNDFITKKGNNIKHTEDIKQFYQLEEQLNITITRVPSHQKKGVSRISDHNRRVDKLARKLVKQKRKES
ncbi:MAG: RNase H family protein [Bacteroidota bacterium]